MSRPRILSVGQCSFDHSTISRRLAADFDAEVMAADSHGEALSAVRAGGVDLVLVNRVGDADGAPGLDLIRSLKADPATASVPVMLVSNFEASQAEAVDAGALKGFGKSEIGAAPYLAALRQALAPAN